MVKDKVELFIEERQDKIVKYIEKVLTQIKNTEVKKIGSIITVDKVENLFKKLRNERPGLLILDEGFKDSKIIENIIIFKTIYPDISILILGTDFKQAEKYFEAGIDEFILKGNSAGKFYNSLVIFLKKEQNK